MLKIAVPNKGALAEAASPDAGRGRLPPASQRQGPRHARPRQRRRVLLPPSPRHRDLRRGGHARRRHHRTRPAARLRRARDREHLARLRRLDLPLRRADRHHVRRSRTSRARASRRRTRASSAPTSPSAASTAEVVRLDGAVESSVRLGVADAIADVVETGSTLRQADLEVFGEPILSSEAVLITRQDAPEPDGLRGVQATHRQRHRRADVHHDGLRHPRRPGRARPSS